jgi:hypothetical protein
MPKSPMKQTNPSAAPSQARQIASRGGKKGGPARANKLSSVQRSNIARKGAQAKNAKGKH